MVRAGSFIILGALLSVVGCGGGQKAGDTPASSTAATTSPYDMGPRAAEAPVNDALATQGEGLFKSKTCSTCHGFGIRITGPDLKGVTRRRTSQWMQQQIQHPDVMTKQDPISRGLLGTYAVQMPNLNITDDEARSLIEFLKRKDKELGAQ
jgi:cytochrome c551/c552